MPAVLLEVGVAAVAAVAAGVAAVAAERFLSAALISAYCLVAAAAAAARWSRAALLVEDAATSASNWLSSSSRSPGVSLPWPLAGMPGTMPWRRCATAVVPEMSGALLSAAVSRLRAS